MILNLKAKTNRIKISKEKVVPSGICKVRRFIKGISDIVNEKRQEDF